ncbi:MAG: hypothetical protein ACLSE8_00140 [Parasutterella sp.]
MNITGQISANWLGVIGNGPLVYVGDHPGCSDGRQNGRGVFNIDASGLGREKHLLVALISMD